MTLQRVAVDIQHVHHILRSSSPLAVVSPPVQQAVIESGDAFQASETTVLYTPQEPTEWINYLFIVLDGGGRQYSVGPDNIPWPERILHPGDVFGRHTTLLSMYPEVTVEITQGSTLFGLHVDELAVLIERWPVLYDVLLPRQRIQRLRSMPVLSFLGDDHIRRLADLVREVDLPAGAPAPAGPEPFLWMVDVGLVELSPADEPFLACAGQAFLDGRVNDVPLLPQAGIAVKDSRLMGLPARIWAHLATRVVDRRTLHALMRPRGADVVLRQVPPFNALSPSLREAVVSRSTWLFTPAGQMLVQAGERDEALYVLMQGEAVWTSPSQGHVRQLRPGEAVGHMSLLGHPQARQLTAHTPAYWLRIARQDLKEGLKRGFLPLSWPGRHASPWPSIRRAITRLTEQTHATVWLVEDERVLWRGREHFLFALLRAAPWAFLLGAFIGVILSDRLSPSHQIQLSFPFFGAAWGCLLGLIYVLADYLGTTYLVTERRIIRKYRMWGIREQWQEMPLNAIQDVVLEQGLLGRLLNYGTIRALSAAEQGNVRMARIPQPRAVQAIILQAQRRAGMAWAPAEQEERHLRQRWVARWPKRALRGRRHSSMKGRKGTMQRQSTHRDTPPWHFLTFWQEGDIIYWRKHRINLLMRLWRPLFLLILLLIPILASFKIRALQMMTGPGWWLVWGSAALVSIAWMLWEYDDWRNDLYILTPRELIDVTRRPLFSREERRVAPLAQVQTVQVRVDGPVAHLLNYGDIIIKTAASRGDLFFPFVPNPKTIVLAIHTYRQRLPQNRYTSPTGTREGLVDTTADQGRRSPSRVWE